jgi:peptide/nickel transport system substrate-binding protein
MDVPKDLVGVLTLAARTDVQLIAYRAGRLVAADEPATMVEAAYALFHTKNPPIQGGTIVRGREVEPAQFNTILTTSGGTSTLVDYLSDEFFARVIRTEEGAVQGELVYIPQQLEVIPSFDNGLLKMLPDGRMEAIYKFRKGMLWHDGVEITVDDALFMAEVLRDRKVPTVSRSGFELWDETEVISPYELKVIYKEYYPFADIGTPQYRTFFLLPKHIFEESYRQAQSTGSYEPFIQKVATTAVFNGPYKLTDVQQGLAYTMEAFEDHYLGRPNVDKIIMRVVLDSTVLLTSLSQLELDYHIIYNIDQALVLEPRLPPNMVTHYYPRTNHQLPVALNLRDRTDVSKPHPILGDVLVRRALLHAIDRDAINEVAYGGFNEVSHSWIWSEQHPHHTTEGIPIYEFDPDKAAKLLDEAGWKMGADGVRAKDGVRLSLEYVTIPGRTGYETSQQMMQAYWADVGVEIVINNMPWSVFTSNHRPRADFDLCLGSWGFTETTNPYSQWHSYAIPAPENNWAGVNYWGWANEENDRLLEQFIREPDPEKRAAIQAQQLKVWSEDLPWLPFLSLSDVAVGRTELIGFKSRDFLPGDSNSLPYWYWRK